MFADDISIIHCVQHTAGKVNMHQYEVLHGVHATRQYHEVGS